jgi:hypothetical protein
MPVAVLKKGMLYVIELLESLALGQTAAELEYLYRLRHRFMCSPQYPASLLTA